jgi:GTP-binding protein HflX
MSMKNPISPITAQTGVLVGTFSTKQPRDKAEEYIEELRFLAETAGIETKKIFLQRVERPNPAFFIGKGKLEEIKR